MDSTNFEDYYYDDNLVDPQLRARIDFELEFVDKIIGARKARGISIDALAKKTHLSKSTITQIENLVYSPKYDTIFKLLTALGYKLEIVNVTKTGHSGHSSVSQKEYNNVHKK